LDRTRIEEALRRTFDDARLSRGERKALAELIADEAPSDGDVAWLRSRAFELAREEAAGARERSVIDWLEDVVKVLATVAPRPEPEGLAEAWFTPGTDAVARIVSLARGARASIDVCVFTLTDDRLAAALLDARRRRVSVRLVTDDEKAYDRGSDVDRLAAAGIPVRIDSSPSHMHHKFAIFDGTTLLTGSYNWTRGAADENQENFCVVGDRRLVTAYARVFEGLWARFAP
jgi:phosphatidylserine/phosphatidylglycerophosphate/cardiolipin synthase-like enzyme